MSKIAVFPGSFDPVTLGHIDIIRRGSRMFDKLIVGIGVNTSKQYRWGLQQRQEILCEVFSEEENIEVQAYEGLTVDFCKKISAGFILRGLRSATDFDYEASIADMNQTLNNDVETVLLFSSPEVGAIQSRIVREILKSGGDISQFVPEEVLKRL